MLRTRTARFTPRGTVLRFALLLALAGCGIGGPQVTGTAQEQLDPKVLAFVEGLQVIDAGDHVLVLDTSRGMIAIDLRNLRAPITTAAVEALVQQKFYDGLTFHRVEPKFVIQTGDPSGGSSPSTGKPTIQLEINADLSNVRGAVGMARPEKNPNGADSQFYILLSPRPSLNDRYAVFGNVLKGMEVADKIERGDTIRRAVLVQGLPARPAPSSAAAEGGPSAPAVPAS